MQAVRETGRLPCKNCASGGADRMHANVRGRQAAGGAAGAAPGWPQHPSGTLSEKLVNKPLIPCFNASAQFHSDTPSKRPGSNETGRGRGLWRIPTIGSGAEGARRCSTARRNSQAKGQSKARSQRAFASTAYHASSKDSCRTLDGPSKPARMCPFEGGTTVGRLFRRR